MNTTLQNFIQNIPKAELHLHIEGTFEPELMFAIAQRNKVDLPYKSVEELKKAYQFSCLQDFLDIYYTGTNVLLQEEDFYDLTMAYFEKCHQQNIRHTEIMFDPQSHTDRGVSFETVIKGINKARNEAQNKYGISSLLIMSYLRHLSEESAFETLKQSLPFKEHIKAVGLDSSEQGNPPSKFERVFAASIQEGYIPLAHAGEEGSSEYVWEALNLLKIHRIDHGNRCLEDQKLVDYIIKNDIALTVCPLSNLELKVVTDLKQHPIRQMLDLGLKVTVNSDDPAYFGGQLNRNFEALVENLDLGKSEIYELVRNSFQYSLLTETEKQKHLKELEIFYQAHS